MNEKRLASGATAPLEAVLDQFRAAKRGVFNVLDYGANGHDDTGAFMATVSAARAHKGMVYIPPGRYRIDAALDLTADHSLMLGAGQNVTTITQIADNAPIIKIGGYNSALRGLSLHYANDQPKENTGANALELYGLAWGSLRELDLQGACRGTHIKQQPVVAGANWMFSCAVEDIFVDRFSFTGLEFIPFAGGISGNVLSNVYVLSRDKTYANKDIIHGLDLRAWDNGVLQQINIESCNPTGSPIYLGSCNGLVLDGVHFESLMPKGDYEGLIYFDGSRASVRNVSVRLCDFLAAHLNAYALFRVNDGARVNVEGVHEADNVVTVPQFTEWLVSGSTDVELFAHGVVTTGVTGEGYFAASPSVLKQRNSNIYHSAMNGRNWVGGSAAPTGGVWGRGDIMWNDAPAAGGIVGWVCTMAGEPGTWKAFGGIVQ